MNVNNLHCSKITKKILLQSSVGEFQICKFLLRNNIEFIAEKTFPKLISPYSNMSLRIDFYIVSQKCCIEFDEFHHFNINFYESPDFNFNKIEILDKVKNNFCEKNSIPLLRIPFDKIYEVPKIITEFLKINLPQKQSLTKKSRPPLFQKPKTPQIIFDACKIADEFIKNQEN